MALVVYDRVQETTATTGTGSITLAGAVSGFQSFAVVGNGNTTFYCIINGVQWEVGLGTYSTSGPTLARTTIYSNSNGNTSPITLSGVSSVFVTYPSERSINYDANGVASIGTPIGYVDTGIVATFASTVAGYNQVIIQNKSNATNASSNFNVSNDAATSTTGYAELGINSSTFTGTGSFNIAGAAYLASASTDLTIGTYGAYNVHFATNSNTTDAMTIYNSGGVSLGGYADPGIGTLYANNVYLGFNAITAAAGTTILTNASAGYQNVVGTTTQTIQLPVATTLYKGLAFTIANASTGVVTVKDSASTTIDTIVTGGTSVLVLTANGTSAGTWVAYSYLPASYDFSTSTANFGTATITNATYQGNTIASGYGGTGLTTFTAANNALYSTSSSALAAGTLPILAGGTGATTSSGARTSLGAAASGANSDITSISGLSTPLATTQGGTGLSSYTTGDLIYSSATNTLSKLPIGTNNYVLTSTGSAVTWSPIPGGSSVLQTQEYTATAGQTTFSVTYTVGSIEGVYRNGIKLGTTDYTASSGTNIVLATGALAGDLICIVSFTNVGSVSAGVNTVSFGSTGLTPGTATAGNIVVAGTLNVANGGTGVTTSTGSGNNVLSASPTLSGTAVIPTINAGAATALTLQSAGTTAVTIDTSQNVGIGTASPVVPLQVANTAPAMALNATGSITSGSRGDYNVYNSGISTCGLIRFGAVTDTVGTDIQFFNRPAGGALTARMTIDSTGHLVPATTATYNLGSTSLRWANVYTSDLHLNNGIGNYTIVEGEEDLFLYNNKNGKTYKFALIEVDPSTAPAKMKE